MKTYTFSYYTSGRRLVPHTTLWRRLLGQKQLEKFWIRPNFSFKAPEEVIGEEWFEEVLKKGAIANCERNQSDAFAGQLELLEAPTPYIPASGDPCIID
jgi:hypothetical protein